MKKKNNDFHLSITDDCIARMLTHDCINRFVSKMNDSDPSGE